MSRAEDLWRLIVDVRDRAPIVHNVTNNVVQADTAAAIAAVGGTQATVHNVEEARALATTASALAVNVGTPDARWMEGAEIAAATAAETGTPWVLDPVAYGLLDYRTQCTNSLLGRRPSVIKGNATELMALAGEDVTPWGADSRHATEEAEDSVRALARRHDAVVAVTGAVDLVVDDRRSARISNGHPAMAKVIGTGCMATAVIGVYLGCAATPFDAAVAGLAVMGIAGEVAAESSHGPGTMKAHMLDALSNLDRATFHDRLRLA